MKKFFFTLLVGIISSPLLITAWSFLSNYFFLTGKYLAVGRVVFILFVPAIMAMVYLALLCAEKDRKWKKSIKEMGLCQ